MEPEVDPPDQGPSDLGDQAETPRRDGPFLRRTILRSVAGTGARRLAAGARFGARAAVRGAGRASSAAHTAVFGARMPGRGGAYWASSLARTVARAGAAGVGCAGRAVRTVVRGGAAGVGAAGRAVGSGA